MKILHSFWTKPWKEYLQTPEEEKLNVTLTAQNTGWADLESMFTFMHWSCHQAMTYYGQENLVLITDSEGAELFKEKFYLPYAKVLTVLDDIDHVDPWMWGYEKVVARSHMKEPFWHIDIDWIFNKKLPRQLETADFVVRNIESDVCINSILGESPGFGYTPVWSNYSRAYSLLSRAVDVPDCLQKHANLKLSANSGIFGGKNIEFIQECCALAKDFVESPENKKLFEDLISLGYRLEPINYVYEKALPVCLAMDKDVNISQLLPFKAYVNEGYNMLAEDFKSLGIVHAPAAKEHKDFLTPAINNHWAKHTRLENKVKELAERLVNR
tara:strand:+ start:154 stop:1134 length:981 start_codon:yes stop_codon:yes gene_type:complete